MEIIEVKGYDDFMSHLSKHGKLYLLFYKSDSEKSNCAYENIKTVSNKITETGVVLTADVNSVRDIHSKYEIQSAPTLLEFENGALKQTVKGCQSIDYLTSFFQHSVYSGEKTGKSAQKRVIVYSTPTCPHCNTLKDYLKRNNISFRDIDVSKDQKMAQELVKKSGQQGVPQTEINGKIIVGFNRSKINEILGIQA